MGASIFVIVWSMVGFYMVLFVAAIKGIPAEVYEAARVDGAGRFRTAITITVPMIRDTVQTAYIYLGILALDAFVYMQALNSNGGPNNGTLVIRRICSTPPSRRASSATPPRWASSSPSSRCSSPRWCSRSTGSREAARGGGADDVRRHRREARHRDQQGADRRRQSRRGRLARAPHAWSVIVFAPLLWVLMSSFKTTKEILASPFTLPTHWNFDNYVSAWTDASIGSYFFNTVIVVVRRAGHRHAAGRHVRLRPGALRVQGRRLIYYVMLAGLTFPIFLAVVPLFLTLRNFGLLNTLPGLILVYVAFALPFTVFFLYAFFKSLPQEVAEAALIDGGGPWRVFFQIMLPMARPGMASVAIFNFLGLWNQFLLPVALNTDPDRYVLSQGMSYFASQAGYAVNFGALFAAVVITVVPVLIVYLIFQRQLQGSVSRGTFR